MQVVLALHGRAGLPAPSAPAALPAAPQETPRGSEIYIACATGCNYNSLPKRKACSQYKYNILIHTITLSILPEGHTIFKLSIATNYSFANNSTSILRTQYFHIRRLMFLFTNTQALQKPSPKSEQTASTLAVPKAVSWRGWLTH